MADEIQAIHDAGSAGKCDGSNEAPVVAAVTGGPVDEGSAFETSVSFTDDDSDSWTATVDYGDGTVENLVVSGMSVGLSHIYTQDEDYTVTVTVTDDAGAEGSAYAIVGVNNVLPSVDVGPDHRIVEGGTFERDGSFADPGADSWTATVDYGHGAGPQPLELSGMTFHLSHMYGGNGSGPFTVTVRVEDGSGPIAAAFTVGEGDDAGADEALGTVV